MVFVDFSCELGLIMSRYYIPEVKEWSWSLFELSPLWHNYTFGWTFLSSRPNNGLMWLPIECMYMYMQMILIWLKLEVYNGLMWLPIECMYMYMQMILIWLKLEVITLFVSFTCELEKVTTRYDFQWVGQIVEPNLISSLSTFYVNWV